MNNKTLLLPFLLLLCIRCSTSNIASTKYIAVPSAKMYEKTIPCDIRMLVQLPDEGEGYIHIGTCVTGQKAGNRAVGEPINYAIEEIQKCACKHGGDIVKIIDFKQTTGQNVIEGGIKSDPNDPVQKLVYEDFITGEVYVEKGEK